MNSEIEKELDEIFEKGKELQKKIADYYKMVLEFQKLVKFDEASERMRNGVVKMRESLRVVIAETNIY